MVTITQSAVLDDVIDWLVHDGFCIEEVSLSNGDIALSVGDSLIGMIAINVSGSWKILDDGDTFDGTQQVAVIVHNTKLLAAAAGDAAAFIPKCAVIIRGPGRIHQDGLVLDAGLTASQVYTALEAIDLQLVNETGSVFTYASP